MYSMTIITGLPGNTQRASVVRSDRDLRRLLSTEVITPGHNSFQVDDVGMLELAHDASLAQEFPPLLLRVAHF